MISESITRDYCPVHSVTPCACYEEPKGSVMTYPDENRFLRAMNAVDFHLQNTRTFHFEIGNFKNHQSKQALADICAAQLRAARGELDSLIAMFNAGAEQP